MSIIDKYLQEALQQRSSDLHFVSGDPVRARVNGELKVLMDERLTIDGVKECLYEIMDQTARSTFEEHESADFAYEIPDVSRFRVNAFQHLNGMGAVFRAIPSQALTLDQLKMPTVIYDLCKHTQGMILRSEERRVGKE